MNTDFKISIYGKLEKYNDTISKARCRIFYKYGNRNGTYITDEFAEKLLATIPYTPVKGIRKEDDFSDHGAFRDEGRIYGIVPQNPNLAWEKHLDEDGVEREYACVDVYLYTAIYKEAAEILSKPQSMELFGDSIEGELQIINGVSYYVFTSGSFLGLQVLGDKVTPCFEGAAFYEYKNSIEDILKAINEVFNNMNKEVVSEMEQIEKVETTFEEVEDIAVEESNPSVEAEVTEVVEPVVETVETVEIIEQFIAEEIVDVTREEVTTENVQESDVFVQLNEELEKYRNSDCEKSTKIDELNTLISTLTMEKENALNTISTLEAECAELRLFKKEIELREKMAVLHSYEGKIDKSILEAYAEKLDQFDAIQLDKELAYELKNSNPNIFNLTNSTVAYVPKEVESTGIEHILNKYKKQ